MHPAERHRSRQKSSLLRQSGTLPARSSLTVTTERRPTVAVAAASERAEMFTIQSKGIFAKRERLVAPTTLSPADFQKVADQIGRKPVKARKIALVAARMAERMELVETRWDGRETTNVARPGDWIVTNLTLDRKVLRDRQGSKNTYVVKAEVFPNMHDGCTGGNEYGNFFKAKGVVEAVYLSGGFDLLAPWGQKQTAGVGYLLLNGQDVYGNNADTFDATYKIIH